MKEVRVTLTQEEWVKALSNVYGKGAVYPFEMFNPCDDGDSFSFDIARLEMKYLGPLWVKKATQKVRRG